MADVSTWSTTAGNNNSASPDGWPENMLPSGVNNSARENMAQVATWRQKFGGWMMENVGLTATVGGGALTVTLRVKDGSSSPSATNKVGIGFRKATLTTGGFDYVEATSGIDVTLASGGTLGFASSESEYIYVYAINNAGAIEIGLVGKSILDEGIVHSSTGIGTGSDSAGVLYSGSGRTDVAVRLIGRITIQHGAGTWSNSPTVIALWSPGIGSALQSDRADLGGSFNASQSVAMVRNGNLVTITSNSAMSHGSASSVSSSAGAITAMYRPSSQQGNIYYMESVANYGGAGLICLVEINTSGTLTTKYLDFTGVAVSRTDTYVGFSISYNIENNIS